MTNEQFDAMKVKAEKEFGCDFVDADVLLVSNGLFGQREIGIAFAACGPDDHNEYPWMIQVLVGSTVYDMSTYDTDETAIEAGKEIQSVINAVLDFARVQ